MSVASYNDFTYQQPWYALSNQFLLTAAFLHFVCAFKNVYWKVSQLLEVSHVIHTLTLWDLFICVYYQKNKRGQWVKYIKNYKIVTVSCLNNSYILQLWLCQIYCNNQCMKCSVIIFRVFAFDILMSFKSFSRV